MNTNLPQAQSERWKPLRSGLLNIYKYDNEEFWYEDGRLLLRGNNGAGKSRILALQLPFLLDGDIASHRVEPDGDPAKSMDWNLLMGKHQDRLGYTWIEFGRTDENGTSEYFTLGCALRAVKGKKIHSRWYFTTRLRIGADLFLLSENNIPLSKEKLRLTLAENGTVYENAKDYRAAVDAALFSLGPRYLPLIELLIRLRKPQLSRKLDETLLSEALSDALSPLSTALLDDAADAFRSLENNRTELDDFKLSLAGVERFLNEYRTYVQVATKRRSEAVRQAHSAYESTRRKLNEHEEERTTKTTELESKSTELEKSRNHLKALEAEKATLLTSPQMKSAENLEEARRRASEQRTIAKQAQTRANQATEQLQLRKEELKSTQAHATKDRQNADTEYHGFCQTARNIDLIIEVINANNAPQIPAEVDSNWLKHQEGALTEALRKRFSEIRHIDELNEDLARANLNYKQAQFDFDRTEGDYTVAKEGSQAAENTLQTAIEAIFTAYAEWRFTLKQLEPLESDEFAEHYTQWLEDAGTAQNPLKQTVQSANTLSQNRISQRKAQAETEQKEIKKQLVEKTTELDRLRNGHQEPPPSPHYRNEDSRETRSGAPLWKLIDFQEHLSSSQRAGFEAALESSTLLDAWVTPEGDLLDPKTQDSFFDNASLQSETHLKQSLIDYLKPCIDADDSQSRMVPEQTVQQILKSIGSEISDTGTWVSASGRWKLGVLKGTWHKTEVEYIGFAAREERRKLHIETIEAELESIHKQLQDIEVQLQQIEAAQKQLQHELDTAPDDNARVQASANLESARKLETQAFQKLQEAEKKLETMRLAQKTALQQRDEDARDLGLFDWREKITQLQEKTNDLQSQASRLWRSIETFIRSQVQYRRDKKLFEESSQAAETSSRELSEAQSTAQSARIHFETLEKTLGADAKQVVQRLADIDYQKTDLDKARQLQEKEERTLETALAVLEVNIATATEELEDRKKSRSDCIDKLFIFAKTKLLTEADPSFTFENAVAWSASRAMEIVRSINEKLARLNSDDAQWKNLENNLFENIRELTDELSAHNQEVFSENVDDGIRIVKCSFQGKEQPMSVMKRSLEEEIINRQQLLEEREREIIENHLVGEIASEIQRLIREGEEWVSQVNQELSSRPTSSGIMLRFVWRANPDGPPGLEAARKQLLRAESVWSKADREAIGQFLQRQIRSEQMADETATWQEQLTRALDYRKWHHFEIECKQDGQWKRLTRKTYGTGSGGEKAIALTIPQFAAAAAHYRSADPRAPRLIMLDEAFVGIDSATRAKLMGLLETFDLDIVMTSEREWSCYPTVSGIAIYQLSSHPDIDAVGVTRWVLNGKDRKQDEQPEHGQPMQSQPNLQEN